MDSVDSPPLLRSRSRVRNSRAEDRGDQRGGDHQSDGRHRSQRGGEGPIGDAREVPTIMFCGLPVIVATLPMFEPMASASR